MGDQDDQIERNRQGIKRIDAASTLAASAAGLRSLWEVFRVVLFVGGFLVMFFRIGSWYGESSAALTSLNGLAKLMNEKIDRLIANDQDQELRIEMVERQLAIVPPPRRQVVP